MGIEVLLLLLGAYLLTRQAPAPGLGGAAPAPAPAPGLGGAAPAPVSPQVVPPPAPGLGGAAPAPVSPLASADAAAVLGQLVATPASLAALLQALASNPQLAAQLALAAPHLAQLAAQLVANPQQAQAIGQLLGANSAASMELLALLTRTPALLALARRALQFPQGGPGVLATLTYGLWEILTGQLPSPGQVLAPGATGPLTQAGGIPQPAATADAASVLGQLVASPTALAALVRAIAAQPQLAAQLLAAAPQLAQLAQQLAAQPQLAAMAGQVLGANPQASMQLLSLLANNPQLLQLARQVLAGGAAAPGAGTPAPGAGTPAPGGGILDAATGLLGTLLGAGTPAPGAGTPAPGAGTPAPGSGILDAATGLLGTLLGLPGAPTPTPAPVSSSGAPPGDARLAAGQLALLAHNGSVRWGVHSATVEALQRRMGGVVADGWIGERTAARVAQLVGYPVWSATGQLLPVPGSASTTGAQGGTVVAPHGQADAIAGLIFSDPVRRLPLVLAAVQRHPTVLMRAASRAPRLAALGQRVAAGAPLELDDAARGELVALLRDDAEFRAIAAQALGVP